MSVFTARCLDDRFQPTFDQYSIHTQREAYTFTYTRVHTSQGVVVPFSSTPPLPFILTHLPLEERE